VDARAIGPKNAHEPIQADRIDRGGTMLFGRKKKVEETKAKMASLQQCVVLAFHKERTGYYVVDLDGIRKHVAEYNTIYGTLLNWEEFIWMMITLSKMDEDGQISIETLLGGNVTSFPIVFNSLAKSVEVSNSKLIAAAMKDF
jgi:hypothetical protein